MNKKNNSPNIITKIYREGEEYDGKYIGQLRDGLRLRRAIMLFDYWDRYEGD